MLCLIFAKWESRIKNQDQPRILKCGMNLKQLLIAASKAGGANRVLMSKMQPLVLIFFLEGMKSPRINLYHQKQPNDFLTLFNSEDDSATDFNDQTVMDGIQKRKKSGLSSDLLVYNFRGKKEEALMVEMKGRGKRRWNTRFGNGDEI